MLSTPGAILERGVLHVVTYLYASESAVDAGVDAWLVHWRRQVFSDRTLERRACALGDAVRHERPLQHPTPMAPDLPRGGQMSRAVAPRWTHRTAIYESHVIQHTCRNRRAK